MDVPTASPPPAGIIVPVLASEAAAPVAIEKKVGEESIKLSAVSDPEPLPSPQNGTEKSPAKTLPTEAGDADSVAGNNGDSGTPAAAAATTTTTTIDDVKTVSLNNETDDRIDSIGVGGQGEVDDAAAAATSNNTPMENNGAVVVGDVKDLDQPSTMSKGVRGDDDPTTAENTAVLGGVKDAAEEAEQPPPHSSSPLLLEGADKVIATENGQADSEQKVAPESSTETIVHSAEGEDKTVKGSELSKEPIESVDVPSTADVRPVPSEEAVAAVKDQKIDPEILSKDNNIKSATDKESIIAEDLQATLVDPVPEEKLLVNVSELENAAEKKEEVEPVQLPKLKEKKLPETVCPEDEVLGMVDEPVMDTLELGDSQELDGDLLEEVEDDDDVAEQVVVKKERCAKSDQEDNEIETIDIDTDDDDDEEAERIEDEDGGSLIGPPLDEDESDGIGEEGEDCDDEVESFEEEYDEFEVSDEEGPLLIGDEEEDEDEQISEDGVTDEERFIEMKNRSQGAKRKMYGNAKTIQQSAKERRVGWLDSGTNPRMHVLDSACRDSMIRRPNTEKVEDSNSQDEGDSDAVIEEKQIPALNRPHKPQQPPPATVDDVHIVGKGGKVAEASEKMTGRECSSASALVEKSEVVDEVKLKEVVDEDKIQEKKDNGIKAEKTAESAAAVEDKNCDKPKSGSEVMEIKSVKDNEQLPTESMDLDSQDSEPVESSRASVLPKAIESETVPEKTEPAGIANAKADMISHKSTAEEKMTEEAAPKTTDDVAKVAALENSSAKAENVLKRKRSPSPALNQEEVANSSEEMGITKSDGTAPADLRLSAASVKQDQTNPSSKKAKLSGTAAEQLQRELEENFGRHDRLLREYITKSSAESPEAIQKHVDQLVLEIETLNDMIRTKEMEWNNLVHLKKVKEELVMRLTRKRHVEEIEAAPIQKTGAVAQVLSATATEMSSGSLFSGSGASSKAAVQANKLIQNLQLSGSTLGGAASKTTQSILQNRANMTTEDLEKEKKNTAKLHRHSIQGSSSSSVAASSIGPNHRNSVSPSPHVSGRASAPAIGSGGRSMTPTGSSTPLPGSNVQHQQQQQQINAAMAAFQAMQQHDLLNGQQHQQQPPHNQFHHQQQQAAAVAAAQQHAAAVAAGQMVGRQGAIKDVRSIIEDYRQRHPESVPKRGRRMKTVPKTNASLMNASGSSLMMMQLMASNSCNINSDNVVDIGDFELSVGGGVRGSVVKASSPGLLGGEGVSASAVLASNEEENNTGKIATAKSVIAGSGEPATGKTKLNAGKVKGNETDRRVALHSGSGGMPRRGSEWQVMLSSDSAPAATTVQSRPSSAESTHSNTSASAINSILTQHGLLPAISVTSIGGSSSAGAETGIGGGGGRGSVKVQTHQGQTPQQQQATQMQQLLQGTGNSLLHGILTKQHNNSQQNQQLAPQQLARTLQQQQQQQNGGAAGNVSGFSPTLARLLTAPERISTGAPATGNYQHAQQQNPVMNLSKNLKSEITITPVVSQNSQQQANQMYNMMMTMQDEDQDDNSADRLVIDEGIHSNNPVGVGGGAIVQGQEFHENEVPECQGCKRKEAQFVCAGCGNQWYCSRECQVTAWDEHSETCTG